VSITPTTDNMASPKNSTSTPEDVKVAQDEAVLVPQLVLAPPNAYTKAFTGPNTILGIAGIIGAGKSTLADQLGDILKYHVCKEPVKDNACLDLFYQDMKKYSLLFQVNLLNRRFALHQRCVWSAGSWIQDRTIYEDPIFAKMLMESGMMSKTEFEEYRMLFNNMSQFLHRPNLIIYLDVEPAVAMERIRKRGRPCEKDLPMEYLIDLKRCYEEWLEDVKNRIPVIRVDWNGDPDPAGLVAKINKAFEQERPYALVG
jgi:deoxyadenosine/deoxycytidine kinase